MIVSHTNLVEMCHRKAVNILLLHAILPLLQISQTVSSCPALPPDCHGGSISVLTATFDTMPLEHRALRMWHKLHIVIRHSEVKYTKTSEAALVLRRLNHAMNGGLIVSSRKEIHSIATVHDLHRNMKGSLLWILGRHTSALSICLIQRHLPSGDNICNADTGWLQRSVMLPISTHIIGHRCRNVSIDLRTCMTFEPDILRLQLIVLRTRVATRRQFSSICK